MDKIVDSLYPTHPVKREVNDRATAVETTPFTIENLLTAVCDLQNMKAPGLDEIPRFPKQWKTQRLVHIS